MPGMTGWDFRTEYNMLSNDIHNRAVVTILTTSVNLDDRNKASAIPAVKEFVNKPLTPEHFGKWWMKISPR